jgi:DNA-binding LacI/PurR family transcriptional regulator
MISSIFGVGSTKNREAGYREALELAGIPFAPELIRKGNYEPESGYQVAMELLALPEPPTAYFCVSDSMACGCIRALCNSGINVPGDVSVLGFDNSPFARTMVPSITTIGLPYAAIGKKAAELLLDQLKNYNKSNEGVLLPHELVLRESVKPLVC